MNLTPGNLKNELWDTLLKLRAGKIDAQTASAIAYQSREILRIVNTEIKISTLSGRKPSSKLLTNGKT